MREDTEIEIYFVFTCLRTGDDIWRKLVDQERTDYIENYFR